MKKEITIVTGFFKINRENWQGFNRTDMQYLEYFKLWAKLKNKIIVYVETEELKDEIMAFRSDLGLKDRTVVNVISDCLNIEKNLLAAMLPVANNSISRKFRLYPNNPEVWSAAYDYVMLMKAWCVCDAINRGQATGMISWLDFGYNHGGRSMSLESDFSYLWEYDFPEKINLFTIQKLDDRPIFEIIMSMDTYFMGGCVVAPDILWPVFWNELQDSMFSLLSCGLIDDDQNIMLMAYRKNPQLFNVYQSDWTKQLYQFGGSHLIWIADTKKNNPFIEFIRLIRHRVMHYINCFSLSVRIFRHMCNLKIH